MTDMSDITTDTFQQISDAVIALDEAQVLDLTRQALADGVEPSAIISEGLTQGIRKVGDAYQEGEVFLPEMLVAAEVVKQAVEIVRPHLTADMEKRGTVVIGTTTGDIHELGKDIVKLTLETNGFDVYDVGIDVPAERFAAEMLRTGAEVVGVSAMLTSTLPSVRHVIAAVRAADPTATVIMGGAPVTEANAEAYGADAFAPNAGEAIVVIAGLAERVRTARA